MKFWSVIGLVGSALISGMLVMGMLAYLSFSWNNAEVLVDQKATAYVTKHEDGSRLLTIEYEVYLKSRNCPSTTEYMLAREDPDDGHLIFRPLTVSFNGFKPLNMKPRQTAFFDVELDLPTSLPPGPWKYVTRTSYSCEWLPGLLRPTVTESQPIKLTIP